MKRLPKGAGFLLGWLALPVIASAYPAHDTQEFSLGNGLKIIVHPDHRAPVVFSQLWYKVGSSQEHAGQSGLSHVLEHMMFQGSRKLCPLDIQRAVLRSGSTARAFTEYDSTYFTQASRPEHLGIALEIMADQMAHARLGQAQFVREINVVKHERLENQDNPELNLSERLQTIAHSDPNYRIPIIGWISDLEHLNINQLRQWYNDWYAPNNAILVIVGDVDPAAVKTQAQQYFGSIPRRATPQLKKLQRQMLVGSRRAAVVQSSGHPLRLNMAFSTPSLKTAGSVRESLTLSLLAELLERRLQLSLVEREPFLTAASVEYNPLQRSDTLLVISATLNIFSESQDLPQIEAELLRQASLLKRQPPSIDELSKAKLRSRMQDLRANENLENLATLIGNLESLDLSWRLMNETEKELQGITPSDIQNAARLYFQQDRSSIAYTAATSTSS